MFIQFRYYHALNSATTQKGFRFFVSACKYTQFLFFLCAFGQKDVKKMVS